MLANAHYLAAFPCPPSEGPSPGTYDAIAAAHSAGVRVLLPRFRPYREEIEIVELPANEGV